MKVLILGDAWAPSTSSSSPVTELVHVNVPPPTRWACSAHEGRLSVRLGGTEQTWSLSCALHSPLNSAHRPFHRKAKSLQLGGLRQPGRASALLPEVQLQSWLCSVLQQCSSGSHAQLCQCPPLHVGDLYLDRLPDSNVAGPQTLGRLGA